MVVALVGCAPTILLDVLDGSVEGVCVLLVMMLNESVDAVLEVDAVMIWPFQRVLLQPFCFSPSGSVLIELLISNCNAGFSNDSVANINSQIYCI